jgi:hypothetical protein
MQLRPESPTNTSCLSVDNNSECDDGGSTLLANVEPPKRYPHCSTCHHTRQGHGKGSANAKCSMCPNNVCSAHGRCKPCTCIHIAQHAIIQDKGMARDLLMLNVPCVQTTFVQLMDVASHVHAYGTYRNRILLRLLYPIVLLSLTMLVTLKSIFYFFVSPT